jgi:hypothetical protein
MTDQTPERLELGDRVTWAGAPELAPNPPDTVGTVAAIDHRRGRPIDNVTVQWDDGTETVAPMDQFAKVVA